jgi:hypothetical protein
MIVFLIIHNILVSINTITLEKLFLTEITIK